MNINLSIWHCQVLFVIGAIELEKLADKSGLHHALIRETAGSENWRQKQTMYSKFTAKMRKSIENLECIFGDFVHDAEKLEFVRYVIDKAKTKGKRKSGASGEGLKEFIEQQESILTEYGMTPEQSKEFVNGLKSKLGNGRNKVETKQSKQQDSLLAEIGNGRQSGQVAEVSLSDKFDSFNAGYRLLAASQHQASLELNNMAMHTARHYFNELLEKEYYKQNGMREEYEKLLSEQRSGAYLGNILFRLIPMAFEVTGVKGAVLKENAIAKFNSLGMTVIDSAVFQGFINPENT